jgi:hypothetical protein
MKKSLLQECHRILDQKINDLKETIEQVREAANAEGKSSMGDKYEITRSMMQLEQEKLSKQLGELFDQQKELEKIDPSKKNDLPSFGSLVDTNNGKFFIATAIGKINLPGSDIYVISALSPLGKKLIESKLNSFELNGKAYEIRSIE